LNRIIQHIVIKLPIFSLFTGILKVITGHDSIVNIRAMGRTGQEKSHNPHPPNTFSLPFFHCFIERCTFELPTVSVSLEILQDYQRCGLAFLFNV
jgi:hypothetical protein